MENVYTDRELLQQVANGDKLAFRHLFELYKLRLFSFVLQMTHSRVDAEEIVQEVFAKLWESRISLAGVEYPGKYIYTIARNKTLNHLTRVARDRRLQQQVWVNLSQFDNATEDILQAQESQRLISKAVSQLSGQRQTLFQLSREQGLTHEEIACQLGLSKSRVKNMLVEILKHIRDYLARYSALIATLCCINCSLLLL
ncbi:sigma-70 family RNA polymerase sigma factor [Niastella caeni]|uniref:Sigma-70 family RNA polymerase sigma factor n=1 Tax=Niastella caeni TaxID=2569763 RepID=A0A4S8HW32_9BACT|nr:sigma-70 family RNA polymerase sigma factor [Niastella caeni]THU39645.1 sigma-70 family RNA polymerase sigma factor [Niastella caeni]